MAEETEEKQVVGSEIYCKRCGMEVNSKPLTVADEVLKDYLRATLNGSFFSKTFKIADGRVQITFEELPATISDRLTDIIKALPSDQVLDKTVDYKMLLMLKKVEFITDDGSVDIRYSASEGADRYKMINELPQAFAELAAKFNETTLSLLRRISITFVLLIKAIADSLITSDFYTGVGLL